MNNKGFTVVELIASFSLTMIISVFLFEVLIDVKDIFVETSIKTNIQEKMGVISKNIRFYLPPVGSNVSQNGNSFNWTFENNKNGATTSNINFEVNEEYIKVNKQKFKMPATVSINLANSEISNECDVSNNCIFKLSLFLKSSALIKDYNYTVVFYYSTY